MVRNKIYLNDTKPQRGTLERKLSDFLDGDESPLAGTNLGKQFGIEGLKCYRNNLLITRKGKTGSEEKITCFSFRDHL